MEAVTNKLISKGRANKINPRIRFKGPGSSHWSEIHQSATEIWSKVETRRPEKVFLQVASLTAKTRANVLIDWVSLVPIFYLENRSIRDYREGCMIA